MSKGKLAAIITAVAVVIIVVVILLVPDLVPVPGPTEPSLNTLSVTVSPQGAGTVSPPGGHYEPHLQVTLVANPATGYTFDYWSGCASGASTTVTLTMDSDKTVTANFRPAPQAHTLTVSVSPVGAGTVSPSSGQFEPGEQVTLTAVPASGYAFEYWDGAASGTSSSVTVTMDSDKVVTAHFAESLGYSRHNPVDIGTPLSVWCGRTGGASRYDNDYEVRITVLQIIRGATAWQRLYERNRFNDPPETGFEYILARVRFEYLTGPTPDTAYSISPVWFDFVSSDGREYSRVGNVDPDPDIRASIYPGASHEGWISFHVAQNDARPVMTYGRFFDGTGGIWFKLYN